MSTYQHSCSQIELVEELRDEDVHFQDVGDVFAFDVSQHINEPFEIPMRWTNPQEIYLHIMNYFTNHTNFINIRIIPFCKQLQSIDWWKFQRPNHSR